MIKCPNFVPSTDDLVLLDMIEKQFAGYSAMSHIIVATLRQRAREAGVAVYPEINPRISHRREMAGSSQIKSGHDIYLVLASEAGFRRSPE